MMIKVSPWLIAERITNPNVTCSKRKDRNGHVVSEMWSYVPSKLQMGVFNDMALRLMDGRYVDYFRCQWMIRHSAQVIKIDRFIHMNPYYVKMNGKQEIQACQEMLNNIKNSINKGTSK